MLLKLALYLEKRRIKNHLYFTGIKMRSEKFDGSFQKRREKTLKLLQKYIKNAQFPKNEDYQERKAIFVDKYGTKCAVGYLLYESGKEELVNEISSTNNLVHIDEISDARILSAINDIGLSREEASLIQPTYGPCWPSGCPQSPIVEMLPWLVGSVSFIILEWLSFRIFGQAIQHTKVHKIAAFIYFSTVNGVVSFILGLATNLVTARGLY